MHDIIIIGAGPAGLTAALYARRAEKTVLLLEKAGFGGQITYSPKIENYPGFPSISGNDLAEKLVEQVLDQNVDFEMTLATGIEKTAGGFTVHTEDGDFESKSVILATGARHRTLGLEGEEDVEGISYCAVCDGAFYKGREVAVIGGGNSAMQEALLLADGCTKVTMLQNLAFLTGEANLAKRIGEKSNISVVYNTVVTSLVIENGELSGIRTKNLQTGEEGTMRIDGMFVCIGLAPENTAFADIAKLDEAGYIAAGESCETSQEGIFTAGDCRTKTIRQITTAAGDGATAALAAIRYCDSH